MILFFLCFHKGGGRKPLPKKSDAIMRTKRADTALACKLPIERERASYAFYYCYYYYCQNSFFFFRESRFGTFLPFYFLAFLFFNVCVDVFFFFSLVLLSLHLFLNYYCFEVTSFLVPYFMFVNSYVCTFMSVLLGRTLLFSAQSALRKFLFPCVLKLSKTE